jgi:hypothetical protein
MPQFTGCWQKKSDGGAVFPGSELPIPTIRADVLCFTSKPVHIWGEGSDTISTIGLIYRRVDEV